MRLVYVQYGDYAEALRRFDAGLPETYQAQRHTVRWVEAVSRQHPTTVICLNAPRAEHSVADGRIHCISRQLYTESDPGEIAGLVELARPDAVICRTPLREVLDWCRARRVPCLPLLADSNSGSGWRGRVRTWRLGRILRSPRFPCVANHNLNASRWLASMGVRPERIVPWDFPAHLEPGPVKEAPREPGRLKIFYVGAVTSAKGVLDLVAAVAMLRWSVPGCSLTVAGTGADLAGAEHAARAAGIDAEFLGLIPFPSVGSLMREHDVVVVPSRHEYPEGLPNTIFEALASGTPLVVSDHPMIASRVTHEQTALAFRASDPPSLAGALARLREEPALYARLSAGGASAYRSLFVGIEWSELLGRFVNDPTNSSGWVEPISLAAVERRLTAPVRSRVVPQAPMLAGAT